MALTSRTLRAALIVTVATLVLPMSMLLGATLGALGPLLVTGVGMPRYALGTLIAVASAATILLSVKVGRFADTLSVQRLTMALFGGIGLMYLGISLVPDWRWMVPMVAAGGLLQALGNPISNRLVVEHVPRSSRGLAMGIKQSGIPVAAVVIGLALPSLATVVGWRGAVQAIVLVAAGCVIMSRFAVPYRPPAVVEFRTYPWPPMGMMRRLLVYTFFMASGMSVLLSYVPLYAHEALGMESRRAGVVVAVMGVAGAVMRIGGGLMHSLLGVFDTLIVLSLGAALFGSLLWLASAGLPWIIWIGALGLGATALSWTTIVNLALIEVSEAEGSGTGGASGLVYLGFFGGFASSPLLFGFAVELSGGYHVAWFLVVAQFVTASLIAVTFRRRRLGADAR